MMSNDSNIAPNWASFRKLWKLVAVILFIILLLMFLMGCSPLSWWSDKCGSANDNSEHLTRIGLLEKENAELTKSSGLVAGLQAKVKALEAVDINFGGTGDNSDLLAKISGLEKANGLIPGLQAKVKALEAIDINFVKAGDDSELADRINVLEKANGLIPDLQAKISSLETANGLIPGLQAKIKALEAIDINFIQQGSAPAMSVPSIAKLYFDSGSFNFPTDANGQMSQVLSYMHLNPGSKASLVGFHDATGSASWNRQLAAKRSERVRQTLLDAGISSSRIQIEKASQTLGTGEPREARRVEVTVIK